MVRQCPTTDAVSDVDVRRRKSAKRVFAGSASDDAEINLVIRSSVALDIKLKHPNRQFVTFLHACKADEIVYRRFLVASFKNKCNGGNHSTLKFRKAQRDPLPIHG